MNDDLISRQAVIAFLQSIPYIKEHPNMGELMKEWIEQIPGGQPKTGRWEHDGGRFANRWICSQCGYKFYFEKSEAKYCPNCGTKMESDNNDS